MGADSSPPRNTLWWPALIFGAVGIPYFALTGGSRPGSHGNDSAKTAWPSASDDFLSKAHLTPLRDMWSIDARGDLTLADGMAKHRNRGFLIVCLPDPHDTSANHEFDQVLESVQRAMEQYGYVPDRYYLPWKPRRPKTADKDPASEKDRSAEKDTESSKPANAKDKQSAPADHDPGLLLFRKTSNPSAKPQHGPPHPLPDILCMLLVTETPTWGIDKIALANSLEFIYSYTKPEFSEDGQSIKRVRCVGPFYSGSASSFRYGIRTWAEGICPCDPKLHLDVISGSASAIDADELQAYLHSSRVTCDFSATVHSDKAVMDSMLEYLARQRGSCFLGGQPRVALLAESNTSYGEMAPRKDKRFTLIRYAFPLNIGDLRYAKLKFDQSNESNPLQKYVTSTQRTVLYENEGGHDTVPSFEPATDAVLRQRMLDEIMVDMSRDNVTYVGIIATDVKDTLYMAERVRQSCPDVVLFTTSADQLFLDPDVAPFMRGALVASTYPLSTRTRSLTNRSDRANMRFSDHSCQGYYNATVLHLHGMEGKCAKDCSVPLMDYGHPFPATVESGKGKPPVWISTVGQRRFLPVAIMGPEEPSTYLADHPAGDHGDFQEQGMSEVFSRSRSLWLLFFMGVTVACLLLVRESLVSLLRPKDVSPEAGKANPAAPPVAPSPTGGEPYPPTSTAPAEIRPKDTEPEAGKPNPAAAPVAPSPTGGEPYPPTSTAPVEPGKRGLLTNWSDDFEAPADASPWSRLFDRLIFSGLLVLAAIYGLFMAVIWAPAQFHWHAANLPAWAVMICGTLTYALIWFATFVAAFHWRYGRLTKSQQRLAGGLAALVILILALWNCCYWLPDISWMHYERSTELTSGVSPLLPLVFFAVGLWCWVYFRLHLLRLRSKVFRDPFSRDRSKPSQGGRPTGTVAAPTTSPVSPTLDDLMDRYLAGVREKDEAVQRIMTFLVSPGGGSRLLLYLLPTVLFIVLAVSFVIPRHLWSDDGRAFDVVCGLSFYVIGLLFVLEGIDFWKLLNAVMELMREIALLPMLRVYSRLPASVGQLFGRYLTAPRAGRVKDWAIARTQIRAIFSFKDRLRTCKITASLRERLDTLFAACQSIINDPDNGNNPGKGQDISIIPSAMRVLSPVWIVQSTAERGDSTPAKDASADGDAQNPACEKPDWAFRMPELQELNAEERQLYRTFVADLEDLIAIQVVRYLSHYFLALRSTIVYLIVTAIVLFIAVQSYPFAPRGRLLMLTVGVIAATTALVVSFFVRLERNEILSRLSKTNPNHISWDSTFLGSLLQFAGPLLFLLFTQLGAFSDLLRTLLEPLFRLFGS